MRLCVMSFAAPIHGIGGLQDTMWDLATGLAQRGDQVDLITAAHPEGKRVEEVEGVRCLYTRTPASGRLLPGRSFGWIRESSTIFFEEHSRRPYDLLHSESTSAAGLLTSRSTRYRPPITVRFHGNLLGELRATRGRLIEEPSAYSALRELRAAVHATAVHFRQPKAIGGFRSSQIIVPSHQQVRDTCRSFQLDPARIHVVPNGIDEELYRPSPASRNEIAPSIANARQLIVCVGRLSRDKGFDMVIRALNAVRPDSAALVFVGDGPERPNLEALARSASPLSVHFTGAVSSGEVSTWLSASDVVAFPSRRDEAAPLTLIQALGCGAAVVGTKSGSVPEVINLPGRNGLIVEPGNSSALGNALREVLVDPELRTRLGRGARKRVLQRYTKSVMIDRIAVLHQAAAAEGMRNRG